MKEITHKELKWLIKRTYEKKLPLYIWGTFGIGKSSVVREVAKELGLDFIDVRLAQLEPSDIRGLPNVITTKINGEEILQTEWITPTFLPKEKDRKAIILFDELNQSPPSVQAQAFELILDRKVGDYHLPDEVVVMGAGNTIEDKANVFDMSAPLLNRFTHTTLLIPTIEEWGEWALKNKIDGRILTYLQVYPNRLFGFSKDNKDKAINTPRSWEFASRLIEGIDDLNKVELLCSSSVGEGVANEFIAFLSLHKKINVEDILKNPKSIRDYKEIDVKYSILGAINEYFKRHKKKDVLEKIINVCKELEVEFTTLLIKMMLSDDLEWIKKTTKEIKGGEDFIHSYLKYLH